ncbi:MAG: hypothetical protein IIW17_07830 [Clostridia bacterium]|nr:hypothetical protein [Clostridia bacterium]
MKRIILLTVCICLVMSVMTGIPAFALEKEALPSYIFDFTAASLTKQLSSVGNMSYQATDGSHCTFTASANDPSMGMPTPEITVDKAAYLVVEYKTTAKVMGEIYISRTDGVSFSQEPNSHLEWQWEADGEWHKIIVPCDGWADVTGVSFSQLRFDPLHMHQGIKAGDTIDLRYFAFFATEQAAKDFDLDEYHAYVADQEKQEQEAATLPKTEWPDPTYTESTPGADDNYEGTLKITYSDDGKYATISYGTGENAVSYTVPNNEVNLFGGYAGTDDLDRSLFDSTQVGAVTEDHDVGIFYFLWHGQHGDPGVKNMQEIIDASGDKAGDVNNPLWGPVHSWHWWNEPLYGYYYIDDEYIMRKHVELLMNAGVDFFFFDTTNLSTYSGIALKLMAILHEFNEQGYDAPEVMFYTNTDAVIRVKQIYDEIYAPGYYPDTWYMIDGKPAIVAPYEANVNDFFTIKLNQWPTEDMKENGWPWMDFEWPQNVYNDANGKPSVINVSIAQHLGTACFSDSALYGEKSNLGRSFNGTVNNAKSRTDYFKLLDKNPNAFVEGLNFQSQWDRAIEADVPYVLVTGWNEWIAQRQDYPGEIGFVDCASSEFSRDAEMMKGGYFDNYYMQLAYNIQRLKGAAPVIVQDARNAVNVTGSFDIWEKVLVTYTDPANDMLDRDAYGFGRVKYTNTTGRNDILASKVTADTKNVYFYAETREYITMFDNNSTWMQLFVDVDCNTETGWYGYDFIINYGAKDEFTTTVARYNGKDGAYSFEVVGEVNYRAKENKMMIAVPMDLLGITNPSGIKLQFKWADSDSKIETMEQFYTDGDAAPLGRLNYTYQNCIDPKTAEQYVPSTESTESTEQASEDVTEEIKPGGCKSIMGGVIVLIGLAALPFAICTKKKKH